MDSASLTSQLAIELKGIASNFVTADYTQAFLNATNETGWAFPVSGAFRELWFKERAKRWMLFALYTENAESFKVNQLSLNQQFDHYGALIKLMDAAFVLAKDDNPSEFTGVEDYKYFGQVAGPGFQYDRFGNDMTYNDDANLLGTPCDDEDYP